MKIPELNDLLYDFEKDDEAIIKTKDADKTYKSDMKVKGLEIESRFDIKDTKTEKRRHLDSNIGI